MNGKSVESPDAGDGRIVDGPTICAEIRSHWTIVSLGDVIDLFDNQRVPLNSRERQERRGVYPYYGAQGVIDHIDGYIFDGRYILVAEDGENLNSKKLPLALFATGKFWVNNHAHIIRGKPEVADDVFLLACLNNANIKPFVTGAAQPKLSQANLRKIEIPLPPLPIQRRIAGILSAYDELIENSQRRIGVLERMARGLYREWFVKFRFPGHESVPRVASSLGEIPEGWEVKTIADVCESVSYGYTASATKENVGPKFLRITDIVPDIINWENVPFCEIPEGKVDRYLLKCGDIVIARTGATTGYAKRLNKRHPAAVFASYLVRVRSLEAISNIMLGLLMESDEYKQFILTNIGGSAQPQANAVVLTSLPIVVPSLRVASQFDALVGPMLDEAELLSGKIQNLRRTRDLLLPRLLSGELAVI
jgi:type I restriction enzyme, S subunit